MLVKALFKHAWAQSSEALALFASKARLILGATFQKAQNALFGTFLYFSKKKKNQNWIKTIGSWHYWYKLLIWHIFNVTYWSMYIFIFIILSATYPETHNLPVLLYFYFFLIFSPWNSNPLSFFLFYFFPFGHLLGTNYHIAMSSYS